MDMAFVIPYDTTGGIAPNQVIARPEFEVQIYKE